MDFYIIGIFLLFGSILLSRFINERGLKKLSPEEKAQLMDAFSGTRKYQLIPIIVLIAAYFLAAKYYPGNIRDIFIIYFLLLGVMIITVNYIVYHKLKRAGISEDYIKTYILSEVIKTAGMIIVFSFLILNLPK